MGVREHGWQQLCSVRLGKGGRVSYGEESTLDIHLITIDVMKVDTSNTE